jgi:hypothetical protein
VQLQGELHFETLRFALVSQTLISLGRMRLIPKPGVKNM